MNLSQVFQARLELQDPTTQRQHLPYKPLESALKRPALEIPNHNITQLQSFIAVMQSWDYK